MKRVIIKSWLPRDSEDGEEFHIVPQLIVDKGPEAIQDFGNDICRDRIENEVSYGWEEADEAAYKEHCENWDIDYEE